MHGDVDPSVGGTAAGVPERHGPTRRRAGALTKDEPLVQYLEHGGPRRKRWTNSSANNAGSLSITVDGGTKRRASTGGRGGPEGG
eukprot:2699510-Pyramimonas_sp.AAC.1